MAYISLYRKYRSQTFEDVMGQDHVIKTLQNAIRLGKVSHAYLFCGTRGTGKTTTARLLAKALNCEKGATPNPCNVCPACISVAEGSAMDIVELDAASHRSIRDIEEIRDNVKFPPMELRYKIFIIDEAHQLSSDAKDAFLKTLEEPPAHAVFILATTEPQSIPVTIRSRCQQFDFRRGSLRDIHSRLKYVTESEGLKAEEAALDMIAMNADGSWRDSLSLLEQVLAYTDDEITTEDVNAVLGTVNQDFLFTLADVLAAGDESGAFEVASQVVESGKDIQQLFKSIAQHFRNLLFATVAKKLGDLATNEETAAKLREQAAKFSKQSLLRAVEIFSEAEHDGRYNDHHRLILELALLKTIEMSKKPSAIKPTESPTQAPEPEISKKPVKREPASVPTPAKPQTFPTEAPPSPRPTGTSEQKLPEFDRIIEKWNLVLQHVKSASPVAYGLLKDATPTGVRNGALVLQFQGEGQKSMLENDNTSSKFSKKKALLAALEKVFGTPGVGIICEVGQAAKKQPVAVPETSEDLPNPFDEQKEHDTLKHVLDIFPNAEIVDGD